jgi:hypothetical protein
MLRALEKANAFVFALDTERSWFRYHPLLADLLRFELRQAAPAELLRLHTAAAEWYAAQGSNGQLLDFPGGRGAESRAGSTRALLEPLSESESRILRYPANEPVTIGDRSRALRLGEYSQDPHVSTVRQARRAFSYAGRRTGAGAGPACPQTAAAVAKTARFREYGGDSVHSTLHCCLRACGAWRRATAPIRLPDATQVTSRRTAEQLDLP